MSLLATLRSVHVADMAVFDWVATGLVAYEISKFSNISAVPIFIMLVLLAIIIHWKLGVPTRLNAYLGLANLEDVITARTAAQTVSS